MPQKLSKTWSYLKKILRKQDEMWEMIENDYQNTLKIQRKTIRTYNIMLKHHTNMEHILETINKSYDAIIELGKNVKEGKRVIADMKGIMMKEGGNFDNIKLDEDEDNKESREITKTKKEIQQKIEYQNELIRKTSAFLHAEKMYLRNHVSYISMIGSNSKVPEIQKNLDKVERYKSASLDMEDAIKARLEKTDIYLSKIDRMSTSTYDVELEEQIIKGKRQEKDDEMEENNEEESVDDSNRENNKDEVSKDQLMNQIEMVLDPKECRSISEDVCQNVEMGTCSDKEVNKYMGKSDYEEKGSSPKREKKKRKAAIDTSVIETEDEAKEYKVSQVPKVQRDKSSRLDTEETIKTRLEKMDHDLAKIDNRKESVNNLNKEDTKDKVNKDQAMTETEMVLDPKEGRPISEDICRNVKMGTYSDKERDKYKGKSDYEEKSSSPKREKKKSETDIDTSAIRTQHERNRNKESKALPETEKKIYPDTQKLPTMAQVCAQYGLNDVYLEYHNTDFINITSYKLFQRKFRHRIEAENPDILLHKLMMLVAAKWREFMAMAAKEENDPNNSGRKEKEQLHGYEIRGEQVAQKEKGYDTNDRPNVTITEANGKQNPPSLDQTKTMEVRVKNIGSLILRDFYPIYKPPKP